MSDVARITQSPVEALYVPEEKVRVTQSVGECLILETKTSRITQTAIEVLGITPTGTRITQSVVEYISGGISSGGNTPPTPGQSNSGESFLERYYRSIHDNLSDPSSSKRFPLIDRYRTLHQVQERIWAQLMNGAGQESDLGRTEIDIEVVAEQDFYDLPPLFRQFIAFEKRVDGDPRHVSAWLPTIPTYACQAGVRLLGPDHGFQLVPKPTDSWAGTWTLVYRRAASKQHRSYAVRLTPTRLTAAKPSVPEWGDQIKLPDYYAGVYVRVYFADLYAPQTKMCTGNTVAGDGTIIFEFDKTPFDPLPEGSAILYETCPELNESVDCLYAADAAILKAAQRVNVRRRAGLMIEREDYWKAARAFFGNNTADRPPERSRPPRKFQDNPYE